MRFSIRQKKMAVLPSPTQVAGFHSAIYEAYYSQVDPNGHGVIGAMEAARFLKKSGLSDVVLSRIWDLSDPGQRGSLDKAGFFVALKLVALAQAGRDINVSNLNLDLPPPKMGDKLPTINRPAKPPPPPVSNSPTPLITSLPPSAGGDWTIKPTEREKYDSLFDSLQPLNGFIPGNKVKGVLMDSKLPVDTLGKIWDLADMDKDGMLDRHEFVVAMHLVYKALEKYAIPNTLPPELMPPSKRKISSASPIPPLLNRGLDGIRPEVPPQPLNKPPVIPIQPIMNKPSQQPPPPMVPPMMHSSAAPILSHTMPQQQPPAAPILTNWVVSNEDKAKFDPLFIKSDIDRDGFVSGLEIKDVFLKSGVPQPVLAHIWALCDIKQSGKLNGEQFALAMWLVERCLKGQEPPVSLTPEMVPPSFRNNKAADGIVENNNAPYSNPELDMISKDIEELVREKLILETDIAQKEADIKIKSGEIKSLQSELDTLAATLKQLENQKGEAQKRLNDLKTQVDKLRSQADEQAEVLRVQEGELSSKKEQLENLRKEEERLEKQRQDSDGQMNRLTTNLQDTQLQISQAKAKITQLQEQQRQMNDAIAMCDTAIQAGDPYTVADTALRITPEFRDPEFTRVGMTNGETPTAHQNGFTDSNDPFNDKGGLNNGFESDPFKSDPFKSNAPDAFSSSNDPFAAAFPTNTTTTTNKTDGFASDPFGAFDTATTPKPDPFDPFGDGKQHNSTGNHPGKSPLEDEKDPFGCDPFAILHAPTRDGGGGGGPPGRPSSPSPALPPKKSKQPPPRPAPPRPMQPSRPAAPPSMQHHDPFSASNMSSGAVTPADPFESNDGFADFADFDAKFSDKPSTTTTQQTKSGPHHHNHQQQQQQQKPLDFVDDPFKNYRYEDPFNLADPFDDDDKSDSTATTLSKSFDNLDAFGFSTTFTTTHAPKKDNAKTFDPFASGLGGRQSVPLPVTQVMSIASASASSAASGRASAPLADPFTKQQKVTVSEDQQLAWAAAESLRLEEARRKRQLQEQADLEYAIALSKQDSGKS